VFLSVDARSNFAVWASFCLGKKHKNTIVNNRGLITMKLTILKLTTPKLTTLLAALAVTVIFAQSAQAREHHYRRGVEGDVPWGGSLGDSLRGSWGESRGDSWGASWVESSGATMSHAASNGRPRAWCGWHMRQLVGGDPGPQYNLARNWASWGHPGPAGIGAIVVWPHHVGKIVGQEGGTWIIESGNDGNRVRTRPLSISGAIAIRWS
jgi:hypothetical protein